MYLRNRQTCGSYGADCLGRFVGYKHFAPNGAKTKANGAKPKREGAKPKCEE